MTSKIISLTAENIKRIEIAEVQIKDGVTIIAGNNGQGKSSLIDAIEMALAGKRAIPPRPIRDGQEAGRIVVYLDDLIVVRKFTENNSYLEVRSRDGAKYGSGQAVLDAFCSSLSFDPVAFANMKPAAQAEMLELVAGIDTTELDEKREALYDERTAVNRDVSSAEASLRTMPIHADAPAARVDTADLIRQIDEVNVGVAKAQQYVEERAGLKARIQNQKQYCESLKEQLNAELEKLGELVAECDAGTLNEAEALAQADVGIDEIVRLKSQLETSAADNQRYAENAARQQMSDRLAEYAAESQRLSDAIRKIDAEKLAMLTNAKYPIDGLGISEDRTVMYRGIPLEQASQAELIRVSAAIGLAVNPGFRLLLIRDGSLLDGPSMSLLAEFAAEHDAQILIERVGKGDPHAIIVEDGRIEPTAT